MAKKLNIGLFGFGCVGQGLYHVLQNSTGFTANISKIVVKDKGKVRTVANDLIAYDKYEILNDPAIDVVVELIDDADEAYKIVSAALRRGKHVVTANKRLLAEHLEELVALQKENGVSLLYEGAVCGSIPIIRTLEEYFDNEELEKVSGIFNGTSNYILTKTIGEKLSYHDALSQAQEKGFAETDPTNDVEGFDPKFKAIIIALHAFGLIIDQRQILNIGISGLQQSDIRYASEKGYKIKLVPVVTRVRDNIISAFVLPQFVKSGTHLFNVDNEFNGVIVEGKFSGEQFLQGRGAGSYPTGAAVLSDISALSYGYKYEYKKYRQAHHNVLSNDVIIPIYLRYNHVLDLEKIDFDTVAEKYTGIDYKYIVGEISLQKLLDAQEYVRANKLFIARVNAQVSLVTDKKLNQQNKSVNS